MTTTELNTQGDDPFAEAAQDNREISHLLDRLSEEGIGRPLYVAKKKSTLPETVQAKTGVSTPEETELVKVGHALRANKDGTAYIILDLTGNMMYITSHPSQIMSFQNYFDEIGFKYLEADLITGDSRPALLNGIRIQLHFYNIKDYLDGRMPENYPQVKTKFDQALEIATERKMTIEATKVQMKKDVATGLSGILGPPPPPATPPISPTAPSTPPATP